MTSQARSSARHSRQRGRRRATKADIQVIRGSGCNLMFVCMGCKIAVCVAAPRPTPALPTLRCSHILCIPTCDYDYTIHRSCCYDPYVRSFGSWYSRLVLQGVHTGATSPGESLGVTTAKRSAKGSRMDTLRMHYGMVNSPAVNSNDGINHNTPRQGWWCVSHLGIRATTRQRYGTDIGPVGVRANSPIHERIGFTRRGLITIFTMLRDTQVSAWQTNRFNSASDSARSFGDDRWKLFGITLAFMNRAFSDNRFVCRLICVRLLRCVQKRYDETKYSYGR